tara:strand:- start:566 stop:1012 length:447 start_codon:yes stop_codon:yes gene_type:complete
MPRKGSGRLSLGLKIFLAMFILVNVFECNWSNVSRNVFRNPEAGITPLAYRNRTGYAFSARKIYPRASPDFFRKLLRGVRYLKSHFETFSMRDKMVDPFGTIFASVRSSQIGTGKSTHLARYLLVCSHFEIVSNRDREHGASGTIFAK